MTHRFSLALDFVRLSAALVVFLHHFSYERFTKDSLKILRELELGHDAVVIFFVLSGYVICFAVSNRNRGLLDYISRRYARLYSVVIPSIFFVFLIDNIGLYLDSDMYAGKIADNNIIIRAIANLTFIQEIQFLSIRYMSNGPLWSLGYEFWYYFIFGVLFFVDNLKHKVLILLVSVLFIGIKIVLLMPVWWLGVLLFQLHRSPGSLLYSKLVGVLGVLSPLLLYFIYKATAFDTFISDSGEGLLAKLAPGKNFNHSSLFIHDYIVAALFGVSLYFLPSFLENIRGSIGRGFSNIIKVGAGATLTIYILHFPLLLFMFSVGQYFGLVNPWVIFFMVLAFSVIFSRFSESKKHFYQRVVYGVLINLYKLSRLVFRKN